MNRHTDTCKELKRGRHVQRVKERQTQTGIRLDKFTRAHAHAPAHALPQTYKRQHLCDEYANRSMERVDGAEQDDKQMV
eukprot:5423896-Pleurochrysis_carterae.AAC.1